MHRLLLIPLLLAPIAATGADLNCNEPRTTIEINQCVADEVQRAETVMNRYLEAAKVASGEDDETKSKLEDIQAAWAEYRQLHCGAVLELNAEGSARGSQMLGCMLTLTRQRTYELWLWYLSERNDQKTPEPAKVP